MKRIGVFFVTLIVIYFSVWGYRLAHPKEYIIYHASSDDILATIKFYDRVMPEESFHRLLKSIISIDNMDVRSILVVVSYAEADNLEKIIQPNLDTLHDFYRSFPKDTTWTVKINESYSRKSNMQMLTSSYSIFPDLGTLQSQTHSTGIKCSICCDNLDFGVCVFEKEKYEGIILDGAKQKIYRFSPKGINSKTYWNPTLKDISNFEDKLIQSAYNEEYSLEGYFREYVGLIDTNGNKKILVGLLSYEVGVELSSEFGGLDDGGDYYFRVLYDMKDQTLIKPFN